MTNFKRRPCPLCGQFTSKTFMKFTVAGLVNNNPGYNVTTLSQLLKPYEDSLIYHRCSRCHLVFTPHYWPDGFLNHIYRDAINHEHSFQKLKNYNKRIEIARQWVDLLNLSNQILPPTPKKLKIIDFGCGWGDFLSSAPLYHTEILGYEQDEVKFNYAKKKNLPITSDIHQLDRFSPAHLIVLNSVLEHLQDAPTVLKQLYSWLIPGGIISITVMDYRSTYLRRNLNSLRVAGHTLTKNLNPVEHVNIYDYFTLKRTLTQAGFNLRATHTSLLFPSLGSKLSALRLFNLIESTSARFLTAFPLSITMYAQKPLA